MSSAAMSGCTSPNSAHSFIKDEDPVTIVTAVLHALTVLSLKALPQRCCKIFLFSFCNAVNHEFLTKQSYLNIFKYFSCKKPYPLILSLLEKPQQQGSDLNR